MSKRLKKKRRAFTLIEVIVSLGLVSVLLTSLFFWYRSLTKQKEEFLQVKGPLMEERYLEQRLQRILPKSEPPFFSSDKSLVFIFDRGTYFDPHLSGKVMGRLYWDEPAQALCLGLWPYPEGEKPLQSPSQTLVLIDGIKKCEIEFYSPPDLFKKTVDPDTVGQPRPIDGWQDLWLKDYKFMPALVKLTLTREEKHGIEEHITQYVFDLPSTILYPKEESA